MENNSLSFFNYQVTTDNEILDSKYNITVSARIDLERMVTKLKEGKNCIRELQACIIKYPEIPAFKNYLSTAYNNKGELVKARKINHEIVRLHPEYLYGKLNLANELISERKFEKVPELLGQLFEIQDLYPERKIFHIGEVISFNKTAILYFIGIGNFEAAKSRINALEILAKKFNLIEDIEFLHGELVKAELSNGKESPKSQGHKKHQFKKRKMKADAPVFENPEVLLLYEVDMLITEEEINSILFLPRESLISDLCLILRDSIERKEYFETVLEHNSNTHSFPLHALFFLSELRATESIPVVLEIARQEESYFDLWFGDFLTENFWEVLYHICGRRPFMLLELMKEHGIYRYVRTEISVFASQIALHQPQRRNEIVDWFSELINFYLENKKDRGLIDIEEIGLMICCIIDFGAPELNEKIEALYAEGLVLIGVTGSLRIVLRNNIENKSIYAEREIHTIYSLYEDIRNWSAYYNDIGEEFEDDADDLPGFNLNLPVQSQPKIGRNDPCPCGSGKKFKKCHGAVNLQFNIN